MTLETFDSKGKWVKGFTQQLDWAGLPSSVIAKYWNLRDGLIKAFRYQELSC